MSEDWYSDAALAKQAALDAKPDDYVMTVEDLLGLWEPRVHATPEERCVCCKSDARPETGGETHHGQQWCSLCVGRDHHEDGPK